MREPTEGAASRRYWLDLFTGTTWEAFLADSARSTGFRASRLAAAKRIKPGDYFLCYLTGLKRLIAVLEVLSEARVSKWHPAWDDDRFPVVFRVKPLYTLTPETAVPILALKDDLSIFRNLRIPRAWGAFVRASPREFSASDAETVIEAIRLAVEDPITRPYAGHLYWREPQSSI